MIASFIPHVFIGGSSLVSALNAGLSVTVVITRAQQGLPAAGTEPREIPVPHIKTPMGALPGVSELPVRKEMPDVMVMNDGTRVTASWQWQKRREEMRKILQYYAVGQMPPPGNVKGKELRSETCAGSA
ncbi:MAG: hypothetical protein NTW28_02680 [Candidatus Solibacter sp.]|nr:hypothetical protein [Candidatus Solibacter sp.]